MMDTVFSSISWEARTTPAYITSLKPNEIFVFGSNLAGNHAGGAARLAYVKWGAVWGQGVGLQGQTYAIPTMHGVSRRFALMSRSLFALPRRIRSRFSWLPRLVAASQGSHRMRLRLFLPPQSRYRMFFSLKDSGRC